MRGAIVILLILTLTAFAADDDPKKKKPKHGPESEQNSASDTKPPTEDSGNGSKIDSENSSGSAQTYQPVPEPTPEERVADLLKTPLEGIKRLSNPEDFEKMAEALKAQVRSADGLNEKDFNELRKKISEDGSDEEKAILDKLLVGLFEDILASGEEGEESKEEINQLFDQLYKDDPEGFQQFLKSLGTEIKGAKEGEDEQRLEVLGQLQERSREKLKESLPPTGPGEAYRAPAEGATVGEAASQDSLSNTHGNGAAAIAEKPNPQEVSASTTSQRHGGEPIPVVIGETAYPKDPGVAQFQADYIAKILSEDAPQGEAVKQGPVPEQDGLTPGAAAALATIYEKKLEASDDGKSAEEVRLELRDLPQEDLEELRAVPEVSEKLDQALTVEQEGRKNLARLEEAKDVLRTQQAYYETEIERGSDFVRSSLLSESDTDKTLPLAGKLDRLLSSEVPNSEKESILKEFSQSEISGVAAGARVWLEALQKKADIDASHQAVTEELSLADFEQRAPNIGVLPKDVPRVNPALANVISSEKGDRGNYLRTLSARELQELKSLGEDALKEVPKDLARAIRDATETAGEWARVAERHPDPVEALNLILREGPEGEKLVKSVLSRATVDGKAFAGDKPSSDAQVLGAILKARSDEWSELNPAKPGSPAPKNPYENLAAVFKDATGEVPRSYKAEVVAAGLGEVQRQREIVEQEFAKKNGLNDLQRYVFGKSDANEIAYVPGLGRASGENTRLGIGERDLQIMLHHQTKNDPVSDRIAGLPQLLSEKFNKTQALTQLDKLSLADVSAYRRSLQESKDRIRDEPIGGEGTKGWDRHTQRSKGNGELIELVDSYLAARRTKDNFIGLDLVLDDAELVTPKLKTAELEEAYRYLSDESRRAQELATKFGASPEEIQGVAGAYIRAQEEVVKELVKRGEAEGKKGDPKIYALLDLSIRPPKDKKDGVSPFAVETAKLNPDSRWALTDTGAKTAGELFKRLDVKNQTDGGGLETLFQPRLQGLAEESAKLVKEKYGIDPGGFAYWFDKEGLQVGTFSDKTPDLAEKYLGSNDLKKGSLLRETLNHLGTVDGKTGIGDAIADKNRTKAFAAFGQVFPPMSGGSVRGMKQEDFESAVKDTLKRVDERVNELRKLGVTWSTYEGYAQKAKLPNFRNGILPDPSIPTEVQQELDSILGRFNQSIGHLESLGVSDELLNKVNEIRSDGIKELEKKQAEGWTNTKWRIAKDAATIIFAGRALSKVPQLGAQALGVELTLGGTLKTAATFAGAELLFTGARKIDAYRKGETGPEFNFGNTAKAAAAGALLEVVNRVAPGSKYVFGKAISGYAAVDLAENISKGNYATGLLEGLAVTHQIIGKANSAPPPPTPRSGGPSVRPANVYLPEPKPPSGVLAKAQALVGKISDGFKKYFGKEPKVTETAPAASTTSTPFEQRYVVTTPGEGPTGPAGGRGNGSSIKPSGNPSGEGVSFTRTTTAAEAKTVVTSAEPVRPARVANSSTGGEGPRRIDFGGAEPSAPVRFTETGGSSSSVATGNNLRPAPKPAAEVPPPSSRGGRSGGQGSSGGGAGETEVSQSKTTTPPQLPENSGGGQKYAKDSGGTAVLDEPPSSPPPRSPNSRNGSGSVARTPTSVGPESGPTSAQLPGETIPPSSSTSGEGYTSPGGQAPSAGNASASTEAPVTSRAGFEPTNAEWLGTQAKQAWDTARSWLGLNATPETPEHFPGTTEPELPSTPPEFAQPTEKHFSEAPKEFSERSVPDFPFTGPLLPSESAPKKPPGGLTVVPPEGSTVKDPIGAKVDLPKGTSVPKTEGLKVEPPVGAKVEPPLRTADKHAPDEEGEDKEEDEKEIETGGARRTGSAQVVEGETTTEFYRSITLTDAEGRKYTINSRGSQEDAEAALERAGVGEEERKRLVEEIFKPISDEEKREVLANQKNPKPKPEPAKAPEKIKRTVTDKDGVTHEFEVDPADKSARELFDEQVAIGGDKKTEKRLGELYKAEGALVAEVNAFVQVGTRLQKELEDAKKNNPDRVPFIEEKLAEAQKGFDKAWDNLEANQVEMADLTTATVLYELQRDGKVLNIYAATTADPHHKINHSRPSDVPPWGFGKDGKAPIFLIELDADVDLVRMHNRNRESGESEGVTGGWYSWPARIGTRPREGRFEAITRRATPTNEAWGNRAERFSKLNPLSVDENGRPLPDSPKSVTLWVGPTGPIAATRNPGEFTATAQAPDGSVYSRKNPGQPAGAAQAHGGPARFRLEDTGDISSLDPSRISVEVTSDGKVVTIDTQGKRLNEKDNLVRTVEALSNKKALDVQSEITRELFVKRQERLKSDQGIHYRQNTKLPPGFGDTEAYENTHNRIRGRIAELRSENPTNRQLLRELDILDKELDELAPVNRPPSHGPARERQKQQLAEQNEKQTKYVARKPAEKPASEEGGSPPSPGTQAEKSLGRSLDSTSKPLPRPLVHEGETLKNLSEVEAVQKANEVGSGKSLSHEDVSKKVQILEAAGFSDPEIKKILQSQSGGKPVLRTLSATEVSARLNFLRTEQKRYIELADKASAPDQKKGYRRQASDIGLEIQLGEKAQELATQGKLDVVRIGTKIPSYHLGGKNTEVDLQVRVPGADPDTYTDVVIDAKTGKPELKQLDRFNSSPSVLPDGGRVAALAPNVLQLRGEKNVRLEGAGTANSLKSSPNEYELIPSINSVGPFLEAVRPEAPAAPHTEQGSTPATASNSEEPILDYLSAKVASVADSAVNWVKNNLGGPDPRQEEQARQAQEQQERQKLQPRPPQQVQQQQARAGSSGGSRPTPADTAEVSDPLHAQPQPDSPPDLPAPEGAPAPVETADAAPPFDFETAKTKAEEKLKEIGEVTVQGEGGQGIAYKVVKPDGSVEIHKLAKNPEVLKEEGKRIQQARGKDGKDDRFFPEAVYDEDTQTLKLTYFPGPTLARVFNPTEEEGKAVRDFLDQNESAKRKLDSQLVDSAVALESNGIVHKDLKPANIIIVPTRNSSGEIIDVNAKIIDFGIAARFGETPQGVPADRAVGTPGFMGYEAYRGSVGEEGGDIFALRVIRRSLWEGDKTYQNRRPDGPLDVLTYKNAPTAESTGLSEAEAIALWHPAKTAKEYAEVKNLAERYNTPGDKAQEKEFFEKYRPYYNGLPAETAAGLSLQSDKLKDFPSFGGYKRAKEIRDAQLEIRKAQKIPLPVYTLKPVEYYQRNLNAAYDRDGAARVTQRYKQRIEEYQAGLAKLNEKRAQKPAGTRDNFTPEEAKAYGNLIKKLPPQTAVERVVLSKTLIENAPKMFSRNQLKQLAQIAREQARSNPNLYPAENWARLKRVLQSQNINLDADP